MQYFFPRAKPSPLQQDTQKARPSGGVDSAAKSLAVKSCRCTWITGLRIRNSCKLHFRSGSLQDV